MADQEPKINRVEVETPKVDATLDLEQVLSAVAKGAAEAARRKGAGAPSRETAEGLRALSKTAQELVTHVERVRKSDPKLVDSLRNGPHHEEKA
jgi:hypothetical protein